MANTSTWSSSSSERPTARFVRASRRHVRKAFKALMRSHKFHIPKYDLPLRIRPVRLRALPPYAYTDTTILFSPIAWIYFTKMDRRFSYCLLSCNVAPATLNVVVRSDHSTRHAHLGSPWIHQHTTPTTRQRQAAPFLLLGHRHSCVLLHIRC